MELHEAIERRRHGAELLARTGGPERGRPASSSPRSAPPPPATPAGRPGWCWRGPRRRRSYLTPRPTTAMARRHPLVRRTAAGAGRAARLLVARGLRRTVRRGGQGGGGPRAKARTAGRCPTGRRRRLRRHGGAARRGRRRTGRLRPRELQGEAELAGRLGVPERLAPVLCRGARPARRQRPPLALARAAAGRAAPNASTGDAGNRCAAERYDRPGPHQLLESVCSGPSCQRAMAHSRSESRLR